MTSWLYILYRVTCYHHNSSHSKPNLWTTQLTNKTIHFESLHILITNCANIALATELNENHATILNNSCWPRRVRTSHVPIIKPRLISPAHPFPCAFLIGPIKCCRGIAFVTISSHRPTQDIGLQIEVRPFSRIKAIPNNKTLFSTCPLSCGLPWNSYTYPGREIYSERTKAFYAENYAFTQCSSLSLGWCRLSFFAGHRTMHHYHPAHASRFYPNWRPHHYYMLIGSKVWINARLLCDQVWK